jgi:ParB-like chromosome segregation protein Spo0J
MAKARAPLQVEYVPIEKLAPYKRNPRTHSNDQIKQIAASIKEFGWSSPIVVDGNYGVVAGHGRLLAARQLEMPKVPVVQMKHLTATQRRALVIAENQIGLTSDWDLPVLRSELMELKALDFDLPVLGFSNPKLVSFTSLGNEQDTIAKLAGLTYSVVIRCNDEKHQTQLLATLEKQGLDCEALIS